MTPVADDRSEAFGSDGALFAEINVTPFVDVMLVLLVIFMVTAPLMIQGVPIDLPQAAGKTLGRPTRPLIVSISRDHALFVGDNRIDGTDLAARLAVLRREGGDAVVYVRADRGVAYGEVIDVLGRFETSGFTRVSLLTAPLPK